MKSSVFDYIYYRFTKFYLKSDGRVGVRSLMAISIIYTILVFDLFMIFIHALNIRAKVVSSIGAKNIGTLAFVLFIMFNLISYFQFKDRFNLLKNKWKHESQSTYRRNGWLVIFAVVLPIAIAFLLQ